MFFCVALYKHHGYKLRLTIARLPFSLRSLAQAVIWPVLLIFSTLLVSSGFASNPLTDNEDLNENRRMSQENIIGTLFNNTGNICIMHSKFTGQENIYNYNYYQYANEKIDQKSVFPWLLPSYNQKKISDEDHRYLDEVAIFFDNTNIKDNNSIIVFYGKGGTKQTDLANHIIHKEASNYSYKAWFSAEDTSKLDSEYSALGIRLGIFSESIPMNEKREIMKNWFEKNPSWLLVYEDADDYEQLAPYLPTSGGYIIITSSDSEWLQPQTKKQQITVIDVGKSVEESDYEPVDSQMNSNLVDNYYVRDKSADINKLSEKLEKYGFVAITGIAGAGKTQFARYYAYKFFRKKHHHGFVAIILCDSRAKLDKTYRDFAVDHLEMPENIKDLEQVKKHVINYLQSEENKKKSFVLIFDNLDNLYKDEVIYSEELKTYLPQELLKNSRRQLIVTSQKKYFFENEEKNMHISGFTDEEAIGFLTQKPAISFLGEDSLLKLAQEFSNLPLGLRCAKLYLCYNQNVSVDKYLELVENQKVFSSLEEQEKELMKDYDVYDKKGYETQRAAISLSIEQLSPEGYYLLKCCAFLSADNVPIQFLASLLAIKFTLKDDEALVKINAVLREYDNYSLTLSQNNTTCISMHRVVQAATRTKIKKEEERVIVGELLNYFSKQLPEDSHIIYAMWTSDPISQKKIEALRALVPHVEKVIKYVIEKSILVEDTIPVLIRLVANYDVLFGNHLLGSQLIESASAILAEHSVDVMKKVELYIQAGLQYAFLANYTKGKEYLDKAKKELETRKIYDEEYVLQLNRILNILGGGIYFECGEYDKAISVLGEAVSLENQFPHIITMPIKRKLGISHTYLGAALIGKNELKAAEEHLDRAIKLYQKETNYLPNSPPFADVYFMQGLLRCYKNQYEKALVLFQKCESIDSYVKANPVDIEESLKFCGWTKLRLGKHAESLTFGKNALAMFDTKLDGEYHRKVSVNVLLHCIYDLLGDKDKSIEHLKESVRLVEECNKEHFYISIINQSPPFMWEFNLEILTLLDVKYNLNLLELMKKIYGDEHFETAYYYARVGKAYESSKKYNSAGSYFQKALKVLESSIVRYIFVEENKSFLIKKLTILEHK